MSEELKAAITVAELLRPVRYRGVGITGEHLFSDCSPMVTHIFETIEQGREHFAGREIHDLPANQPQNAPARPSVRPQESF